MDEKAGKLRRKRNLGTNLKCVCAYRYMRKRTVFRYIAKNYSAAFRGGGGYKIIYRLFDSLIFRYASDAARRKHAPSRTTRECAAVAPQVGIYASHPHCGVYFIKILQGVSNRATAFTSNRRFAALHQSRPSISGSRRTPKRWKTAFRHKEASARMSLEVAPSPAAMTLAWSCQT